MNPLFLTGVTQAGGGGLRLGLADPPSRWRRPLGMTCAVLLATGLHGSIFLWYTNRPEPLPSSEAKPLPMIDMVLTAPPAPALAQATQPPAPKKPEAVKKPDSRPIKKTRPKPIHKADAAKPVEHEKTTAASEPAAAADTSASQGHVAASPRREIFTPARSNPNYLSNPRPVYPGIARIRHWEGSVLLRVHVTAEGLCDKVTVQRSSGYEVLDESAMEAVRKWRFVPARRGDIPEASWVTVPIDFTLG